jgi:hypothetical protein
MLRSIIVGFLAVISIPTIALAQNCEAESVAVQILGSGGPRIDRFRVSRCSMPSFHECRASAVVCQRTADRNADPADKLMWEEMAAHWLFLSPDPNPKTAAPSRAP